MPRPPDPAIDAAITQATLTLLEQEGFARMSMVGVATQAGVGRPAIYRRFNDKAELVASAIASRLPALDEPPASDRGGTRKQLWQLLQHGLPEDGATYVGLIGGLIAEQSRHPELIEAFRRSVLLPRRAVVQRAIERGQERGDIRRDVKAEAALDLLAGPFLARVFAGADTGPRWRRRAFDTWWTLVEERKDR